MPTGMGGLELGKYSHSTQTPRTLAIYPHALYSEIACLYVRVCMCALCMLTTMGLPCRCEMCVGGTVLYNTV